MVDTIILTTQYDFIQRFQLYRNRQTFDMSGADRVAAALIDPQDGAIILEAVEQVDSVEGANWAESLVAVVLTDEQTTAIGATLTTKYGKPDAELMIEIRVELDGVSESWKHRPITVEKGYIS